MASKAEGNVMAAIGGFFVGMLVMLIVIVQSDKSNPTRQQKTIMDATRDPELSAWMNKHDIRIGEIEYAHDCVTVSFEPNKQENKREVRDGK